MLTDPFFAFAEAMLLMRRATSRFVVGLDDLGARFGRIPRLRRVALILAPYALAFCIVAVSVEVERWRRFGRWPF